MLPGLDGVTLFVRHCSPPLTKVTLKHYRATDNYDNSIGAVPCTASTFSWITPCISSLNQAFSSRVRVRDEYCLTSAPPLLLFRIQLMRFLLHLVLFRCSQTKQAPPSFLSPSKSRAFSLISLSFARHSSLCQIPSVSLSHSL